VGIEVGGAFVALVLAGILLALRKQGEDHGHRLWMAAGLAGMAILDLAHALVPPGTASLWLHGTAILAGGAFFVTMWLPRRMNALLRAHRTQLAVALAALGVCAVSLWFVRTGPAPIGRGVDTTPLWCLSMLGGLGFLVAGCWFLLRHRAENGRDDRLFACFCFLFAGAGVLEGSSVPWGATWWWWHALRLVAYGIALFHTARTYHGLHGQLQREIRERERSEGKLREAMNAAQESEKELCMAVGNLQQSETALMERVAELVEARDAAIRMREEADNARLESERARESLQAQEKRLRSILDSIQAGVLVVDAETHAIVDANSAALAMIGALGDEVLGRDAYERIYPSEQERCRITDPGTEIHNVEHVLLTANGQPLPILRTVIPVVLDGRKHLLDSFVDISERKQAELELLRSNEIRSEQARALAVLLEFSQSLVAAECRDTVLEKTVAVAAKLTCSHRVSIMLPEDESCSLRIVKATGIEDRIVASVRVPVGGGIAGLVFESGSSVVVNTPDEAQQQDPQYESAQYASVPLVSKALSLPGRVVGVLNITEREGARPFDSGELKYIDLMCNIAAAAIDDIDTRRSRDEARDSIVVALAKLAEHRDSDTGKHLDRVTRFALTLAHELQTTEEFGSQIDGQFLRDLERAIPLHDVGKVAIPDHILLKPGRLSPEEMAEMRTHAEIGAKTIRSVIEHAPGVSFLTMAEVIAWGHHEWYDGTGYPRGLTGEDIPLSARIAAVADVYDALTTKRVYKDAMPHEKASSIILEGWGAQFDPTVIDAFVRREDEFIRLAAELADEVPLSEPHEEVLVG